MVHAREGVCGAGAVPADCCSSLQIEKTHTPQGESAEALKAFGRSAELLGESLGKQHPQTVAAEMARDRLQSELP